MGYSKNSTPQKQRYCERRRCLYYLILLTIVTITHKIRSTNPAIASIVRQPTIKFFAVAPSGLFPDAQDMTNKKQYRPQTKYT